MWSIKKPVKSFYDDIRLDEFSTFGTCGGKFSLTFREFSKRSPYGGCPSTHPLCHTSPPLRRLPLISHPRLMSASLSLFSYPFLVIPMVSVVLYCKGLF